MPAFFTLFTKWKLNICALLRTSLEVITLEIFFSNNFIISFCLDLMYSAECASEFLLINISNLFIKKQRSNGAIILTYSRYFLGCPQFCLIRAREAKVDEGNLAAGSIGVISAEDVSIWGISERLVSAESVFAEGTCIDAGPSGICSWLSIK